MQKQDEQVKEAVPLEQARKDLQKIVGLPVTRAWKGYGTAIFFDLGGFSKCLYIGMNGEAMMPDNDDWSICVDDWKLSKDSKVILSATDFSKKEADQASIKETLETFTDDHIKSANLSSDKSAITLEFGSGKTLQVENPDGEVFYFTFDPAKEMITLEQARKELQKLVGLPVAQVWNEFGNEINLELGKLHPEYLNNPKGDHFEGRAEWTIRNAFDWRIKQGNAIVFDSTKFAKIGTDTEPVKQVIKQFEGAKIVSVELNDDAASMLITFDSGAVLQINRDKYFFFDLRHNRKPFLGIDKYGRAYYDHSTVSKCDAAKKIISLEQARKDLQKIVGLPVARAWKGFGTAIFLELGWLHLEHLREPKGYRSSERGDWTLGELWYWKITHKDRVIFDATNYDEIDEKPIPKIIKQLEGAEIISVQLNDDTTHLTITLDRGLMLQVKRDGTGFFNLSYNHIPFLGFDEDGTIHYEQNKL